jgi:hypothetical protein
MKVYMVTRGDYSDYGVVGLFASRELAQGYIVTRQADYTPFNDIEEWEVHSEPVSQVVVYSGRWSAKMPAIDFWHYTVDAGQCQEGTHQFLDGTGIQVQTFDKEKTTKIVADFRAQYLATEAGIS